MNNMNNWIEHLHHPLVFAGFGLFLLALLLRPLFLNNKKLTGTATERLLSKGMILVFILALLAIIGGIALSWKATPEDIPEKTGKSNAGQSIQQYEGQPIKERQQVVSISVLGLYTGDYKQPHFYDLYIDRKFVYRDRLRAENEVDDLTKWRLSFGEHQLRVSADGFVPYETPIEVTGGATANTQVFKVVLRREELVKDNKPDSP